MDSPSTGVSAERVAGTDPLEVVTDLDVAALARRTGIVRGTIAAGVLRTNERFLELTGLPAPGAHGWDWMERVHESDRERLRRAFEAACRGGARSSFTIRLLLAGNEIDDVRVTVAAVTAAGQEPVFVASFDHLNARSEPRDDPTAASGPSEPAPGDVDPFAVLMAALPLPVAYVSPGGFVDYANAAWIDATGIGADTDLPRRLESDAAAAALGDALASTRAWTGPARIGAAVGEVSVVPIAATDGGGVLLVLDDAGADPDATVELPVVDAAGPESIDRLIAPVARLVDRTPDYAAIVTPDGQFLHLNPPALEALGAEGSEALRGELAQAVTTFVDATTEDGAVDVAQLSDAGSLLTSGEIRIGDLQLPVAVMLYTITDEAGEHRATLVIARDRSEERQARDEVAASHATVHAIVEPAPAGIFAVDADLTLTVWNPACEELFGWTAAEVLGGPVPLVRESGEAIDHESYRARFAAGEVLRGRGRFQRRDGSGIVVDLASAPVLDRSGALVSVVTVAVDMTVVDAADQELEYRAEVDQMVAGITRSLVDATADTIERRVGAVLRTLARRSGADAAGLLLHGDPEARFRWPETTPFTFTPTDGGGAFCCDAVDGHDFHGGWVLTGEAGTLGALVLRWSTDPGVEPGDLDSLEMVTTALVAAVDRVDAEQAVRLREERFRVLAEHSDDLVAVMDEDLILRYVSPAAARQLGLEVAHPFDPAEPIVHPEDRDDLVARLAQLLDSPVGAVAGPFTARLRTVAGDHATFEITATNLVADPVIGGVVLSGHDVSAREAMERQLRDGERRFRGLVQNLAESVTVLGPDGNVKYASPGGNAVFGFDPDDVAGMNALDYVLEPDRDRVAEVIARAFAEPGVHGPVTLRMEDAEGRIRHVEALGHNRLDDPDVEGVVVTARDITERVEAEEAARRSDARLSAIVENLSDVVTIVGPDGDIVYTSPAAEQLFGFVEGDESYTDPIARMHPDDRDEAMTLIARQIAGEHPDPVRFRLRAGDGSWRVVEAVARDMSQDPDVGGIVVTTRDVSDRMRAESLVTDQAKVMTRIARGASLHETLTSICDVLERQVPNSIFGILLLDEDSGAMQLGGGPRIPADLANAIEATPVAPEDPRLRVADLVATAGPAELGSDWRTREVRQVADRLGLASLWSTPILDSGSLRVIGVVVGCFDVSHRVTTSERAIVEMFAQTAGIAIERQVSEDLLAYRANHDALTGLPNRVLFLEFLAHALGRAQRGGTCVAVLFLDLDRFKHVNDSLGHDAGDVLLRQLAERLRVSMRPSDVVARLGGDEFTVLCDGLEPETAEAQVSDVARRLLDVIERPLTVDGEDRRLSTSIGIAISGAGSTPEGMLTDADAAMYEAKQHGKARWEIFDDTMRSTMHARLDLESRLERAIERDEFRLFLQPIVDLATGRCLGGEALLRWHDPEIGIITPDRFIGLAEETGLIIPMGEWALAEACRTVAKWEQVGLLGPDFTMSVNLSARQVAQADLVERVRSVIAESGPTASRLCLEITESVLMEESSVDAMRALKELGVHLSIDDFGTGYSSLGYLKRFPVDSVKVDRSFVDGLGTDSEDSAIVTAVVSLGHALGLAVVAEGVETAGQLRELLGLGCDRAQGYWFSGPRSVTEFAGMLHAQPWLDDSRAWAS